jgi:hypothetical protein
VKIAGIFNVLSDSTCSNQRVSEDVKRRWNGCRNECVMDNLKRWEVIPERECVEIKVRRDIGKGGRVSGLKIKYKFFSPKKRILTVR